MEPIRIIEVKESVFADNDRQAEALRQQLKQERTFLMNLMSSPGSGKTTTLLRTIEKLKPELRIGVMEADIDSAVDAETDARIRAGLNSSLGDATVVLISHRITTLMHADCILVLDKGKVAQIGTHEQLIAQDGIYRDIYDLQLKCAEEVTENA